MIIWLFRAYLNANCNKDLLGSTLFGFILCLIGFISNEQAYLIIYLDFITG